jgi:tetratricopeptide (TPR) repeat protein
MIRVWLLLGLSAALPAGADSAATERLAAGVAEFTAAYQAWDGARFAAAAEIFRQATTNAGAGATPFYWLGTAHFHRLLELQHRPGGSTNAAAAAAALDTAVEALTVAVKLDPRQAESHALLGTLYGLKIDGNLVRGMRFGPRVQKHCRLAMECGADNPRVQYLLGTCRFHTAKKSAAWREVLATLLVAEKLFEAESRTPAGPFDPRWGRDSCLTFIGRTYEKLGQSAPAADYYRKALALRPQDYVAQAGLSRVTNRK